MSNISKYIIVFGIAVAICSNLFLRFGPKYLINETESLREVLPQADFFLGKLSDPPHYAGYKGSRTAHDRRVIGYAFLTTDLAPEEGGYSGPIKAVVGIDLNGKITGVKILEHTETSSYVKSLPEFIAQFKGKSIYDDFKLGYGLDGITGATITSEAIARSVRKSIQNFIATMKLAEKLKEYKPSFWKQFKNPNIYLTIGVFILGITSIIVKKRRLRKFALFVTMVFMGFLANNYIPTMTFASTVLGKLPPLSYGFIWYLTLALSLILSFIVVGFFCGWVCPFGAAQELAKGCIKGEARVSRDVKRRFGDVRLGILFFVGITTIALNDPNVSNFEPFSTLFTRTGTLVAWIYLTTIGIASFFNCRFFCKYLCAVGVIFGWLSKIGIYKVKASSGCIGCGSCVTACPTEAIQYLSELKDRSPEEKLRFDYSRCISCLECSRVCPERVIKLTKR
ncbi:MAG: FMN-binding protein [Candidatus Omnitrophota bacterium]